MCIIFHAKIQDGRQKWQENDFWENSPVDSADTLQVKYFAEIALSRTVSVINAFLYFTQTFKMAVKNGGKAIFGNSSSNCIYPARQKFGRNRSLSHCFRDKYIFHFTQKFKMSGKNGGKAIFGKSRQ